MDAAYDKPSSVKALVKLTQERRQNEHAGLQLGTMFEDSKWGADKFTTVQMGAAHRLVYPTDAPKDIPEEVVASFQGIICSLGLAPFTEQLRSTSKQVRYLKQSLALTAFGDPVFDEICKNIARVHAVFGRVVGNRLQECAAYSVFEEFSALQMWNRYLTPKRDLPPNATALPISSEIDPQGYLARAAGQSFVYAEDNRVFYFERQAGKKDNDHKFAYISPIKFQVGDIVEVQVSFALLPIHDGKYKTSLILRAVSLMDGTYTQDAAIRRISVVATQPKPAQPATLKRRVGYFEEETSATRARLEEMEIVDNEEVETELEKDVPGDKDLD